MDLTERTAHFEFGENWASYSRLIDDERMASARANVTELCGNLAGKSFLDIGSGSGIMSAAALDLGASRVLAIDLDENSVATTRKLLSRRDGNWGVRQLSVFGLQNANVGEFDVVYSWGVLHHTGKMWRAVNAAAAMVKPGGIFAFSLYTKTPLCGAWRVEKRIYRKAPRFVQKAVQYAYLGVYALGLIASGQNPIKKFRSQRVRGMDSFHDAHDWLGGYPYESATPEEVEKHMARIGFEVVTTKPVKPPLGGILGSGCSEYVYRRR